MGPRRQSSGTPAVVVDQPRLDTGYLGLPPLRRSIGPMTSAMGSTDHASWIGSWRRTGLLTDIGHALDPTHPAGVVDGLASTGEPSSWADSAELSLLAEPPAEDVTTAPAAARRRRLPLQRRASRRRDARTRLAASPTPAAKPGATPTRAEAPAPTSAVVAVERQSDTAGPGAAAETSAPPRQSPVVQRTVPAAPGRSASAAAALPVRRLAVLPADSAARPESARPTTSPTPHGPPMVPDRPRVGTLPLLSAQRIDSGSGSCEPIPGAGEPPAAPARDAPGPASRQETTRTPPGTARHVRPSHEPGAPSAGPRRAATSTARTGLGAPLQPGVRPWLAQREERAPAVAAMRLANSAPSAGPSAGPQPATSSPFEANPCGTADRHGHGGPARDRPVRHAASAATPSPPATRTVRTPSSPARHDAAEPATHGDLAQRVPVQRLAAVADPGAAAQPRRQHVEPPERPGDSAAEPVVTSPANGFSAARRTSAPSSFVVPGAGGPPSV